MPRSYKYTDNGKELIFTPGKNGSLTYQASLEPKPFDFSLKRRHKTVPSPYVTSEEKQMAKKRREGIMRAIVGSSRG